MIYFGRLSNEELVRLCDPRSELELELCRRLDALCGETKSFQDLARALDIPYPDTYTGQEIHDAVVQMQADSIKKDSELDDLYRKLDELEEEIEVLKGEVGELQMELRACQ